MAIPDFTAQEELLLKQVAQTQQNNGFMTRTEVNDIVASYGASFKSTPQFENLTINTGTVTPTRRAQITFIGLITEGNQPFDELDVILADNFHEGDIIVVRNAMRGTQIATTAIGNIYGNAFRWVDRNSVLMMVYLNTNWQIIGRYPEATVINRNQAQYLIPFTTGTPPPLADITVYSSWAKCLCFDPSTEVQATATLQITATAGTSGNVQAVVDDGSFIPLVIGSAGYIAAEIPTTLAAKLNMNINAGTAIHGYSSTVLLDTLTITAPVGRGAGANGYQLNSATTGGAAAVTTNFVGGVDASEASCTLDFIYGFNEGMEIILTNSMSSDTITLTALGNIAPVAANVIAAGASQRMIYDSTINAWTLAG